MFLDVLSVNNKPLSVFFSRQVSIRQAAMWPDLRLVDARQGVDRPALHPQRVGAVCVWWGRVGHRDILGAEAGEYVYGSVGHTDILGAEASEYACGSVVHGDFTVQRRVSMHVGVLFMGTSQCRGEWVCMWECCSWGLHSAEASEYACGSVVHGDFTVQRRVSMHVGVWYTETHTEQRWVSMHVEVWEREIHTEQRWESEHVGVWYTETHTEQRWVSMHVGVWDIETHTVQRRVSMHVGVWDIETYFVQRRVSMHVGVWDTETHTEQRRVSMHVGVWDTETHTEQRRVSMHVRVSDRETHTVQRRVSMHVRVSDRETHTVQRRVSMNMRVLGMETYTMQKWVSMHVGHRDPHSAEAGEYALGVWDTDTHPKQRCASVWHRDPHNAEVGEYEYESVGHGGMETYTVQRRMSENVWKGKVSKSLWGGEGQKFSQCSSECTYKRDIVIMRHS